MIAIVAGAAGFLGSHLVDDAPELPLNVGNPVETSILELAGVVMSVLGKTVDVVHEPAAADDPARRRPDVTRAEALLGFRPKVALRDGIARTASELRARR